MKRPYDIFISYRRDGGWETAYIIYEQLEKAGYRVFFDLEQMKIGNRFNIQLLDRIAECRDFILVLPPHSLDRCRDENDWVRLEIEHALRCGKPIIPIMLGGFDWPEDLPPSIREVQTWHGLIAEDAKTFPDKMAQLKNSLHAKPRTPFLPRRSQLWLVAAAVLLLAGIGGIFWRMDERGQETARAEYAAVCTREADAAARCMTVFHQTLALSDGILSFWKQFYDRYAAAGPDAKKELVSEARRFLIHQKKQLETAVASVPVWKLEDRDRIILTQNASFLADLEAFHNSVYPSMIRDFRSTFATLEKYLEREYVPQSSVKHMQFVHDIYEAQVKSLYYQYLALLAAMPEKARKDYRTISTEWQLFPNAIPSADPADLEAAANKEMKRAETFAAQFSSYVAAQEGGAALNDPELAAAFRGYVNARTDEALKRTKTHEAELDAMRARFLETDRTLTEAYERAARKFAIHPGDDPDLMWGKVLRMATLADNAHLQRTAAARRNEALARTAREQGTDTTFLTDMPYTLTVKDMFTNVVRWIDDCERNIPPSEAARARFSAARAFYKDVAEGKLPCQGIQVVGTLDDKTHPVYRIGDIVTRRNGQPVATVEEYKALLPTQGADTITLLRYSLDGRRETLNTSLPQTEVLTAFLPMKEHQP